MKLIINKGDCIDVYNMGGHLATITKLFVEFNYPATFEEIRVIMLIAEQYELLITIEHENHN